MYQTKKSRMAAKVAEIPAALERLLSVGATSIRAAVDSARTLAMTNNPNAALAQTSAATLDIHVGPDLNVASTKTFVSSAAALLALIAEWKGNDVLRAALGRLQLMPAAEIDRADLCATLSAGQGSSIRSGRGQLRHSRERSR